MFETRCMKIKLKSGSLERVKEWVLELNQRKDEVIQTLDAEGVVIESVFLDSTEQGDYLIYYMKAESFERAHKVAQESRYEIDVYHRIFKQATFETSRALDLLVDFEHFSPQRI